MTLDEAIKHAEEVMVENWEKTKGRNASDPIAINCFECAEEHRQLAEWLKDYKGLKEQQSSGDAISRQAALNAFGLSEKTRKYGGDHSGYDTLMKYEIQNVLEDLPPVTPQQKTAYWIDDNGGHGTSCSKCGKWYPHPYLTKQDIIYCCGCGARMFEPQKSVDRP